MKKTFLAIAIASLTHSLLAATGADDAALKAFAKRTLSKCPDSRVVLEPMPKAGPVGFISYTMDLVSSDSSCGTKKYLLYSPVTQQVIIGTVIALTNDPRPVETRIAEQASDTLKSQVTATVAPFPLPDGLHGVAITKETQYGPFSYHGYVDASQQFLIVGIRGNLRTDPGRSLRDSLGLDAAVRRGNSKAKIEIIELSDFQCPSCGRAHKKVEPIIEKHLGRINYARLDLPLFEHHEWSLPAALGARAIQKVAPAQYWTYVNFLFANQETVGKTAFDKVLQAFAEDHEISWAKLEKIYHSDSERLALLEQVSRAFDNGVTSTPTYIINGQMIGFGPEGAYTVKTIKEVLGIK